MKTDDNKFMSNDAREALKYRMPPNLRFELESRFAAPARRASPSRPWFWAAAPISAAVALVLAFSLGRHSALEAERDSIAQELVANHVRSMMAAHLSDVVSTDQHTVKPWFEGRLDFGADVRNFSDRDFPLIGGRLDYLQNRTVAALIYKHGQHVINLFEWPSTSGADSPPRFSARRGYQLFEWRKAGMQYWVISDLNATDLQKFAEMWQ